MKEEKDYVSLVSEIWKNETEENKRNMAAEEEVERSDEYIKNLLEDDEEKQDKQDYARTTEITEEDIKETMKEYGLTYEEAKMAAKMGW